MSRSWGQTNRAGKTTTLNAISGIVKVKKDQGEIFFKGIKINGMKPGKIVAMGLIQIPEGRKLFPHMTVKENLEMGAYLRKDNKEIQRNLDRVLTLFPVLKQKLKTDSRELSGGQQQMVASSEVLWPNPEMLVLDEPSLGFSPLIRQQLAEPIKEIHREGVILILVEQNACLGSCLPLMVTCWRTVNYRCRK